MYNLKFIYLIRFSLFLFYFMNFVLEFSHQYTSAFTKCQCYQASIITVIYVKLFYNVTHATEIEEFAKSCNC